MHHNVSACHGLTIVESRVQDTSIWGALPTLQHVDTDVETDTVAASQESFNSEQGFGSPVRRHNGALADCRCRQLDTVLHTQD